MNAFLKTFTCCVILAVMTGCASITGASSGKPAPVAALAPAVSQTTETGSYKVQTIEFVTGVSSTSVERIAKEYGCAGGKGAGLITSSGPVEVYRMLCESGKTFLAKCELRQCKAM
ncbi:hypothetical protein LPB67_01885 [Undibacterium sp. Jales W-56]|uniref:hypothetical protein n=1 Tax=Undibacterium sp. Jales W-56 TaxID=2897325 RepID=UPI0021D34D8E|nr:hypothetical protein [Undibacterium sp. Jales W-56]MCU6432528.1 hypothetical protein [Undibacterium sp. Jales W-56]